jgi:hypothetical protein
VPLRAPVEHAPGVTPREIASLPAKCGRLIAANCTGPLTLNLLDASPLSSTLRGNSVPHPHRFTYNAAHHLAYLASDA